ncbi:putative receptor-like protein kinase At4g00960 [Zingiber officinale]|uniref:putative receptor-like protein kinase At4g00960 n=1 Tax=Zingiber officinale TaxID=94328 RepID=UPI001C4D1328|nr:putative receptor-like protein kinase At4g00960 [Zingiber officinale]
MASSSFSLLLPFLLFLFSFTGAQELFQNCDPSAGNFSENSSYQSNLERLLSTLASDGYATGFLNTSVGGGSDQVFGLVNCRGDINATECRSCLYTATAEVTRNCPSNRGAEVWYEFCLVRFSDQPLPTSSSNRQQLAFNNVDDAPEPNRFAWLLGMLMNRTADAAANSSKRFAIGEASYYTAEFPSIYDVMQCTRDLSQEQCRECLGTLFVPMPPSFVGKQGGRVLGESCSMRFELYPSFFEGSPTLNISVPPPSAMQPAPPPTSSGGRDTTTVVLATAIPAVFVLSLASIIFICYRRRLRKQASLGSLYETDPEKINSVESLLFDYHTLKVATGNFSEENKLGEGGFGAVYKGTLPNGQEIAVKRLLNSGQGLGELKNELVLVARLQHRNLVKLFGVCLEQEKMIVYEYVPNRSLDTFLYDSVKGRELHWGTRYKIITGIARGLRYLHEESQLKIIHRDLKASNVLLDAEMNPKISDFGLAKLFDVDQTQGITNRVVGTFGYMSPEYAMHGQFSSKSDVFSFGVLVLEILTGRKNTGSYNSEMAEDLMSYIWGKWDGGAALEIADPALGGDYEANEMLRCIQIGLLCVQESPYDRPTMSTVVVMLNAETVSLQAPTRPVFSIGHSRLAVDSGFSSNASSNRVGAYDRDNKSLLITPTAEDVSISEVEPR